MVEAIGWMSSATLGFTIGHQVHKQWKEGQSDGVSRWLFIGQVVASAGFTVYSVLVDNWVFVVTNSLMLCNALLGFGIVVHHRRRQRTGSRASDGVAGPSSRAQATSLAAAIR